MGELDLREEARGALEEKAFVLVPYCFTTDVRVCVCVCVCLLVSDTGIY